MRLSSHTLLLSVVILCSLGAAGTLFAADEIHWTLTGQTSVTVDWRGTEAVIRYGPTTAYGQTVTAQPPSLHPISSPGPFWEAKVIGLQENTLYHYSIGTGPDHTFRTPPPHGSPDFTIAVEGDIGDSASFPIMAAIQSQIAAAAPAFVLAVGDLTYADPHGQAHVDQHFNDVMVWSQDVAYMPVWGNHEWENPTRDHLKNYKGRFDLPNSQTSPGAPAISCCGKDWYWLDYGNVRFIAYPEPWAGALIDWNTKMKKLMDDGQKDPAITFIVTFGHRPAYSSGRHPGKASFKEALDALGARYGKYVLNLSGHSHNYERTTPQNGVVHLTTGTGGAELERDGDCLWSMCEKPDWSAFRAMHHGVVTLHFTASAIEGSFLCGPADGQKSDLRCAQGTVADSFTITAVAGGNSRPAPNGKTGP
jgi:hypothetical protein